MPNLHYPPDGSDTAHYPPGTPSGDHYPPDGSDTAHYPPGVDSGAHYPPVDVDNALLLEGGGFLLTEADYRLMKE